MEHPSVHKGISSYNKELVDIQKNNIDIFSNDELKPFKRDIQSKIDNFTDKIGYNTAVLKSSWFNVLKKGGSIDSHVHGNNYISGSYYYKVPKGSEPFQIQNPINSRCWDTENLTKYNDKWMDVSVISGSLILFPSFLFHRVKPCNNISRGLERVTFSFNCI